MNELASVLSLSAIAALLFFPYNSYRIDKFRQQVFGLRDELFDEARKGNISFDSPAYKATRYMLNGAIRFAHRISFSRLFAYRLLMSEEALRGSRDGLVQAMNSSPKKDRELCGNYIQRCNVLVLFYVLSSPLVILFVLPQAVLLVFSKLGFDFAGKMVNACKKQFADFDRLVFREGQV